MFFLCSSRIFRIRRTVFYLIHYTTFHSLQSSVFSLFFCLFRFLESSHKNRDGFFTDQCIPLGKGQQKRPEDPAQDLQNPVNHSHDHPAGSQVIHRKAQQIPHREIPPQMPPGKAEGKGGHEQSVEHAEQQILQRHQHPVMGQHRPENPEQVKAYADGDAEQTGIPEQPPLFTGGEKALQPHRLTGTAFPAGSAAPACPVLRSKAPTHPPQW